MITLINKQMSSYMASFCCILLSIMANDLMASKLTIYADKHLEADSITVQLYEQVLNANEVEYFNDPHSLYTVAKKKGVFHFTLPVEKLSYINVVINKHKLQISGERQMLLRLYVIEPGDDVTLRLVKSRDDTAKLIFGMDKEVNSYMDYRNYDFHFTGDGSGKYSCRYAIDSGLGNATNRALFPFNREDEFIKHHLFEDMETRALTILRRYQSKITSEVFNLFELDMKSNWRNKLVLAAIKRLSLIKSKKERALLVNQVRTTLKLDQEISDNQSLRMVSKYLTIFQVNQLRMNYCAVRGNDYTYNEDAFYYLLKQRKDHPLQEKSIITLLCFRLNWIKNGDQVLRDALPVVKDPYYKSLLQKMANSSLVGKTAFNFILPDQQNNLVQLSDFKGKVVFIDFWFTGCGACKHYFEGVLSKVEEQFKNQKDLVFISISVDRSKSLWQKSINGGVYTSKKVINLYTNGEGSDHEIIQHYQVSGYPKPMIIDREGKVFIYNNASLKEEEGLISQLKSALK